MQQTKEGWGKKSDVGNSVVVMLFSELFSLVFRIMVAAPSAPWSGEEQCLSGSRDPIVPLFYVMDFEVAKRYNDVQRIARLQNGPWRVPRIVVGLRVNSQLFMIKTFMWLCLSV